MLQRKSCPRTKRKVIKIGGEGTRERQDRSDKIDVLLRHSPWVRALWLKEAFLADPSPPTSPVQFSKHSSGHAPLANAITCISWPEQRGDAIYVAGAGGLRCLNCSWFWKGMSETEPQAWGSKWQLSSFSFENFYFFPYHFDSCYV